MEHHLGDFSITVRDIRQFSPPESDSLTLLWLLEGGVTLHHGETPRQMRVDELAMINRRQRWQLSGEQANAVMILNLATGWLTRLDSVFFCQ
jgi:transcriptional regulator, AraC family